MDFFKFKKSFSKFHTSLIAAVLVTSISVPVYACERNTNTYSKNQNNYTYASKGFEQFFTFSKTIFERFNSQKYNWPTYYQWTKRNKSTPTPYKTAKPSPTSINSIKPSPTATNTLKPSPTKTNTPKPSPTTNSTPRPSSNTTPSPIPSSISADEQALLDLVNQARLDANLKPLAYDVDVAYVATIKAKDMVDSKYFDHTSPTYGSPFDMMKSFGIKYGYAGENIAAGYSNVQDVFNGWMNSPGHKANILNQNFTHCGFGIVNGGTYGGKTWVQMFISKP